MSLQVRDTVLNGKSIKEIRGGFGEYQKCMLARDIAELHDIETFNINKLIRNNIARFKKDIDYRDLKAVIDNNNYETYGYTKQGYVQAKNIFLLSERGYVKLANIMKEKKYSKIIINEFFNINRDEMYCDVTSNEYMFYEKLELFLDIIGLKHKKQYYCCNKYRIDFYIPELLLAIEYDEPGHIHTIDSDIKRQAEITNELGCKFLRIDGSNKTTIDMAVATVISHIYNTK